MVSLKLKHEYSPVTLISCVYQYVHIFGPRKDLLSLRCHLQLRIFDASVMWDALKRPTAENAPFASAQIVERRATSKEAAVGLDYLVAMEGEVGDEHYHDEGAAAAGAVLLLDGQLCSWRCAAA